MLATPAQSFHIRSYRPDDHAGLLALLAELLPGIDAETHWQWIYRDNPHGTALTWLAVDDTSGELAGCTSFFRRRLWADGQEVEGAMGGDGWVAPRFRRRGIAAAMHRATRAGMREHGIVVMFGTPMPANGTPLGKAGARDVTTVPRYVRPLAGKALRLPAPLGALLAPLVGGFPTRARLEPMLPGDPRVDEVWVGARPDVGVGTVRDLAFYTWRFFSAPSRRQTVFVVMSGQRAIGTCALEVLGSRLRIVDLIAADPDWPACIRAIMRFARGLESIEIKTTTEQSRRVGLWREGFIARDAKPLNVLLPPGDPDAGLYFDHSRWVFSWADSDVDHAL
jgi:GNAT superfamily N-acetyltransferase